MWLITAAFGGTLFYTEGNSGTIKQIDTRNLTDSIFINTRYYFQSSGMATSERFLVVNSAEDGGLCQDFSVDLQSNWVYYNNYNYCSYYDSRALAYDLDLHQLVAFGWITSPGAYGIPIPMLGPGPRSAAGAEWDPIHGGFLVVDDPGNFYRTYNYGAPIFERAEPPEIQQTVPTLRPYPSGLGFDPDTKIMWYTTIGQGIWGLDPFTLDVIVYVPRVPIPNIDGAACLLTDPTPDTPDPELLVTGTCPGTLYITAVDATPGGDVTLLSGTRPGSRAAPAGTCAGTAAGLDNPVPRTVLTANDAGIAATRIHATRGMCGRLMLQAVDMDSCLATSVRTVPP